MYLYNSDSHIFCLVFLFDSRVGARDRICFGIELLLIECRVDIQLVCNNPRKGLYITRGFTWIFLFSSSRAYGRGRAPESKEHRGRIERFDRLLSSVLSFSLSLSKPSNFMNGQVLPINLDFNIVGAAFFNLMAETSSERANTTWPISESSNTSLPMEMNKEFTQVFRKRGSKKNRIKC